eukprot:scaffold148248_cov31-Tisochrysis_lutea.AAC.5
MGWEECELADRGREEARLAGRLLKLAGVRRIERVYTSVLSRSIKSAWLMLDEMELGWTPIQHEWRLNERHYGALQGLCKEEAVRKYGLERVREWRRGYLARPPPREPNSSLLDRRYSHANVVHGQGLVSEPLTESLADAHDRVRPWLDEELWPRIRRAMEAAKRDALRQQQRCKGADELAQDGMDHEQADREPGSARGAGAHNDTDTEEKPEYVANVELASVTDGEDELAAEVPVFVVSLSHNMMRAILMELEHLTAEQVELLNIPFSIPLTLQLDDQMRPIATPWAQAPLRRGWYLGDPQRVAAVLEEIEEDLMWEPPAESDVGEEMAER